MTDYCSAAGAQQLADKLGAYWYDRGFEVRVRVELQKTEKSSGATNLFVVRSDLIGGRPTVRTVITAEADSETAS